MFIRKFIIMSKQTLKDVKGHIKLEVRGAKGKISLSVEGVPPKEDTSHKLYAVTDEKHGFKEISLGVVNISSSGRGKLDLSFNPKSVNKSEIDIDGFNILVLKEESVAEGNSNVLLAGYIHTDDGTISKLNKESSISKKPKVEQEVQKEQKQKKETLKTPEKLDQPVKTEKLKETEEKEEVKETFKEKSLEKNKDKKETTEDLKGLETKIYVKSKDREEKPKECESFKASDNSFKNYHEQLASYTLDLLKFFKKIKPFKEEIQNENFKWWEIDDDKLNNKEGFLPYYKYISDPPSKDDLSGTDVTCKDQIDKYNKYLFGVSENEGEITHYIYGIPGRHERNEHPYGGKTGFVTWLEDKSDTRNGYWLIYIDSYTGNVVRPI